MSEPTVTISATAAGALYRVCQQVVVASAQDKILLGQAQLELESGLEKAQAIRAAVESAMTPAKNEAKAKA